MRDDYDNEVHSFLAANCSPKKNSVHVSFVTICYDLSTIVVFPSLTLLLTHFDTFWHILSKNWSIIQFRKSLFCQFASKYNTKIKDIKKFCWANNRPISTLKVSNETLWTGLRRYNIRICITIIGFQRTVNRWISRSVE